ncbi:MAG TPA: methionyl-tRNA formyltransferase, partial [Gemmatales bacterium]|nr:methionyl-tRNA formyltransferase [Gemmatales bacterium]
MRLLFMGTGTFAEPTLALLLATPRHSVVGLVTNPDRPAGRGKTLELQRGIKTLAQQHQLEIYQPESVNTPEAVQRLGAFQADLFVVAAYGQILKPEVLAVPPRGAINVHASLLPKYRGAAPIAWAIWHGETETGVTIIRLTPSLDAGDMLEVVKTPIGPRETTGALEARLAELGAQAALAVIDRLEQGEVAGRPQDPAAVTRAPKLTKDHGRLDWSRPADLVARQAYAMQPWPTAYADLPRPSGPPLRLLIREAAAMPG